MVSGRPETVLVEKPLHLRTITYALKGPPSPPRHCMHDIRVGRERRWLRRRRYRSVRRQPEWKVIVFSIAAGAKAGETGVGAAPAASPNKGRRYTINNAQGYKHVNQSITSLWAFCCSSYYYAVSRYFPIPNCKHKYRVVRDVSLLPSCPMLFEEVHGSLLANPAKNQHVGLCLLITTHPWLHTI